MNTQKKILFALLLCMAVGGVLMFGHEQSWEYNFVKLETPWDMRELYTMGEQGWEVASPFQDWQGRRCVLLKRKRPGIFT